MRNHESVAEIALALARARVEKIFRRVEVAAELRRSCTRAAEELRKEHRS